MPTRACGPCGSGARAPRARRRRGARRDGTCRTWVKPFAPRLEGAGFWPTAVGRPCSRSASRFVGEPVAALCAESPAQAVDACDLVEVDYEPLAAIADADAALGAGRSAPPRWMSRATCSFVAAAFHGDVDGAFARAQCPPRDLPPRPLLRLAARGAGHRSPRGKAERLTVWTGTQAPHIVRAGSPAPFDLQEDHVRVIVPDTGGGFGQKMYVQPEDLAVAALARVARPPGQVDRDAARESGGRLAGARGAGRDRGGGGPRRRAPGASRARPVGQRRVSHPSVDGGPRAAGHGLHHSRVPIARPRMRGRRSPSPPTSRRSAPIAVSA